MSYIKLTTNKRQEQRAGRCSSSSCMVKTESATHYESHVRPICAQVGFRIRIPIMNSGREARSTSQSPRVKTVQHSAWIKEGDSEAHAKMEESLKAECSTSGSPRLQSPIEDDSVSASIYCPGCKERNRSLGEVTRMGWRRGGEHAKRVEEIPGGHGRGIRASLGISTKSEMEWDTGAPQTSISCFPSIWVVPGADLLWPSSGVFFHLPSQNQAEVKVDPNASRRTPGYRILASTSIHQLQLSMSQRSWNVILALAMPSIQELIPGEKGRGLAGEVGEASYKQYAHIMLVAGEEVQNQMARWRS
ncbi:hypothetical protein B0H11DRAFT_1921759 [Mycena galericulata]|nr:hypothetical protein B0H11DRAFT_1921759 [Mycena galericulata]